MSADENGIEKAWVRRYIRYTSGKAHSGLLAFERVFDRDDLVWFAVEGGDLTAAFTPRGCAALLPHAKPCR